MTTPTGDYREYHKDLGGRSYRISRIFITNFTSMVKSPLPIIVMAFSYFFLFFSIMGIALSSPLEDLQDEYLESIGTDTFFEVLPKTSEDLHKMVRLDSNFTVNYTVENIGTEPSTPLMLLQVPNSAWEYEADLPTELMEPGDRITVSARIRVPGTKYTFGELPQDGYKPEPEYTIRLDDDDDAPRDMEFPIDIPELDSINDFYFFGQSVIYEDLISRFVMLIVVPMEMITVTDEFGFETALSHPAISSMATLVSIEKEEPGLYVDWENGEPDLNFTSSFEITMKDSNVGPYHVSLRAAETKDLRVRIRNTGDEVLSIDLESLLMPIYDWYW
ncbi:MAG: hypothetical protein ACMUHB_05940, partial [Thermoplasmatota archaeon]